MATKPKTRWTYSFSNLGPKKQIAGTTFYKVNMGSETKWLSMEGIKMLEKARQAGVQFKTVRKAAKHFTLTGTRRRLKTMRMNLQANLDALLAQSLEGFAELGGLGTKGGKGILSMLKIAGLDGLRSEFEGLLTLMNEDELRRFFKDNWLLLTQFFDPSELFRMFNATMGELQSAVKQVQENGIKLRDKMLKMINERMTDEEIAGLKPGNVKNLLMTQRMMMKAR